MSTILFHKFTSKLKPFYYYNLNLSIKGKNKHYIRLIQENLIKFLLQDVYLIYTRLLVYTI